MHVSGGNETRPSSQCSSVHCGKVRRLHEYVLGEAVEKTHRVHKLLQRTVHTSRLVRNNKYRLPFYSNSCIISILLPSTRHVLNNYSIEIHRVSRRLGIKYVSTGFHSGSFG